jgi:glycosyltransferase involved in cell wall biosynthesis
MSIKVSVIIPTFKRPELLLKCLGQLTRKNFPKEKYEVIIITDGLDMETVSELTEFYAQQTFLNLYCYSSYEKKGHAAARNKGVQYAKGELVIFTEEDCLPLRTWIHEYWSTYTSSREKEIAFAGKTIVPYSVMPDHEKNVANVQTAEFATTNCAITKTALTKVNGFDENFSIAWFGDSDLQFKLIKASIPIHYVKAVIIHPVHKAKWGTCLTEQRKTVFNALLYKKHPELYKQKISTGPAWNYYAMVFLFCFFAISIFRSFYLVALISFSMWLWFVFKLSLKRVGSTSKKISQVIEMIVTSAIIPFLSVFWSLYGSFKYKTLFLRHINQ